MTRSFLLYPLVTVFLTAGAAVGDNPYASNVVSYDPGSPVPGLNDPTKALGEPSRMNDDPIWPTVVTAFNPAFIDIVSISPGGHLTLEFDSPILNDPNHPFGIDFIVFGNSFFTDGNPPSGVVSGLFEDGGFIEVSEDGETWHTIPGIVADGLYPTIGYQDSGAHDQQPGEIPTDFTRPVDPSLTLSDFMGLNNAAVIELYDGSGGGAGVDISWVELESVQYVRISNPPEAMVTIEVDAIAKVTPEMLGDLNGDGVVNVLDLLILLENWGVCPPRHCPADFNNDGLVNVLDLLILLENWG